MPARKGPPQKPDENARLGYPTIENLIETEDFEGLNKSFSESYGKLKAILDDKSAGLKKHKEARKAMKSYELTTDLLKELLQLKFAMQEEADKKK